MAAVQRAALILIAAIVTGRAMAGPQASSVSSPPLPTLIAADGGRLRVENRTDRPVWLHPQIEVERLDGRTWVGQVAELDLTPICPEQPLRAIIALMPGEGRDVVPWRGYACGAQCPATCSVNFYAGPEPHRFIARTAFDGAVASNPFRMPPRPKRR